MTLIRDVIYRYRWVRLRARIVPEYGNCSDREKEGSKSNMSSALVGMRSHSRRLLELELCLYESNSHPIARSLMFTYYMTADISLILGIDWHIFLCRYTREYYTVVYLPDCKSSKASMAIPVASLRNLIC